MKNKQQDLVIIGGGIMGLMTAYYASRFVKNITIIEKRVIGSDNKEASSFSFTRSIRNDYLDPLYATMSYEAQLLWKELEAKSKEKFFIDCGCLNLAKKSITPNMKETYAEQSFQNIKNLKFATKKFGTKALQKRFPQFEVDMAYLDVKAGFLYLPPITDLLLQILKERNVQIKEITEIINVEETAKEVCITTTEELLTSKKVVITAGRWANDVLGLLKKNTLSFPITPDKPQECKYFYPNKNQQSLFMPEHFPVFAYLDIGIYGHPIFDKEKGAVKIGYYNPPDFNKKKSSITSINDFINECLPALKNVRSEKVMDADQCYYDLVSDDNFILGKLPNYQNISVGTGWRGTGYKFAPLIGKILAQLALQNGTVYNIQQFSPERFVK
ncbi:MAG: FAD-dependent oxidoreductase [Patescibacteria group bacterium]